VRIVSLRIVSLCIIIRYEVLLGDRWIVFIFYYYLFMLVLFVLVLSDCILLASYILRKQHFVHVKTMGRRPNACLPSAMPSSSANSISIQAAFFRSVSL